MPAAPPLNGLRVLDCSRLLPGPYCSRWLADLGADVVRVDHPDPRRGDMVRGTPLIFAGLNHGKGSVALDLTVPQDRDAFFALVERADVVLESFRPGVLDRLGCGWAEISAANPAVVLCSITGYGQEGPLADRAGHDIAYLARSGVLGVSGPPDGEPLPFGAQVADLAGGALPAVIGILAALRERDGTPDRLGSGLGQHLDVSMTDGSRALLAIDGPAALAGEPEPPRGSGALSGSAIACYRTYRCADGFVALGALEAKFWAAWCHGVGRPDLVEHQGAPPGSPAGTEIEAIFAARSRAEWDAFAAEHDCCLEPVLSPAESFAAAAGAPLPTTADAATEDGEPVRVPAPGLRFSRSPLAPGGPTPTTGADDTTIATRWPERDTSQIRS